MFLPSISTFYPSSQQGPGAAVSIVAVASAHDAHVIEAIKSLQQTNISCKFNLFGYASEIEKLSKSYELDVAMINIIDCKSDEEAAKRAVASARSGESNAVMKGLLSTSTLLHEVLIRETGLRLEKRILSHVALIELQRRGRHVLLTDAALNIAPDLGMKERLIDNAVEVAQCLGVKAPVVANLCAVEKVNRRMLATVEAAALQQLGQQGHFATPHVSGPLALDNALYIEAAKTKGITDPCAGLADILLAPNIEAANLLYKGIVIAAGARSAGLIVGTRVPIILTSRADSAETKRDAIAFALHLERHKIEREKREG